MDHGRTRTMSGMEERMSHGRTEEARPMDDGNLAARANPDLWLIGIQIMGTKIEDHLKQVRKMAISYIHI